MFSFTLHNFTSPPEGITVGILQRSLCTLLGHVYYSSLALGGVGRGWFCIEIGYRACQVPKINKSKELCCLKKWWGEETTLIFIAVA